MDNIQEEAQELTRNVTDSSLAVQPKKPDVLQPKKPTIAWTNDQTGADDPNAIRVGDFSGEEQPQGDFSTIGEVEADEDHSPNDEEYVVKTKDTEDTIPFAGGAGTYGKNYSDAILGDNGRIYHKFQKVKPYTIEYKGRTAEVDSLNVKKAMYQMAVAYGDTEDPRVAFYGYDKLPDLEKEGWIQGVWNGVVNTIPSLAVQGAGFIGTTIGHAVEGVGYAISNEDIINFGNDVVSDTRDIVNTVLDKVTFQYDEFGRGTNALAEGIGSVAVSMGVGAVGRGALYAMSALEGTSLGYQADVELGKRGINGFAALALSGVAGAGGFAIGASTAPVQRYAHSTLAPAGGWVKMMRENPSKFFSRLAMEHGLVELFDGATEVGQDLFASYIGKGTLDEEDWNQAGTTFISSLLVGGGISAYQTYHGRQTLQNHVNKIDAIAKSFRGKFEEMSKQPGSPFTMEMFDALVDRFKEGRSVPELAEIVKTQVFANVDRIFGEDVSPEFKKQFVDTVKKLSTDGALLKLMDKVDTNVDTMISSIYGDGELTQGQKDMFRVMMRGIAINQLVYRGLTPDEWMPNAGLYLGAHKNMKVGENSVRLGNVRTDEQGNTAISVNTNRNFVNSPQTALLNTTQQVNDGNLTANQQTSKQSGRKVKEAIKAGKTRTNLSGTIGAGAMRHEMGHVMNMFTGLENVPEFVSLMQDWVETVLPGITASSEGKTAEQEAIARAFEFASDILKPLGLEGKTAEYMNLLLSVAQANSYVAAYKNYVETFSKVAKRNDEIIRDILKGFSPDDVAAFDEFCKSGKNEILDTKTLTAIYNALNEGITTDGANEIKEKLGNVNFVGFQKNYRDLMGEQKEFYTRAVNRDRVVASLTSKLKSVKTGNSDGSVDGPAVLDTTVKTLNAEIAQKKEEAPAENAQEETKTPAENVQEEKPTETEVRTTNEIELSEAGKTLDRIGEELSDWEKHVLEVKDDAKALADIQRANSDFDLYEKLSRRSAAEVEEVRAEIEESLKKPFENWGVRTREDANTNGRIIDVAFGKSEAAKKLEEKYRKAYGNEVADRILTSVAHSVLLENVRTMDDVVEMFGLATESKQAEEERVKARKKEIDDITALFEPYKKDMTPASPEYNSLSRAEFLVKRVNNLKYDTENAKDSIYAYLEGLYQELGYGRKDMDLSPQTIINDLLKEYYMARGGLNNVLQEQAIQDKPEIKKLVQDNIRVINDVITVIRGSYYTAKSEYSKYKEEKRIESEEFVNVLKNPNSDKYITRDGDLVDIRNTPISTESYNWTSKKTYLTEQKDNIRRLHVALNDFGVANGWKDQGVEKANTVKKLAEKDEDVRREVDSRLGAIESMDKSKFETRKPQLLNKIDFAKENALEISEQVEEERKKTNGNVRDINNAIVKSMYDTYVSDFNEENKNFEEKLLSDEEFKAIKEQATQDALEEIYDKFVGSIDLSYITTKDDWVSEVQKLKKRVEDIRTQESIVGVRALRYNGDDRNAMYYNQYFFPNILSHLGKFSSMTSMGFWGDLQDYVEKGLSFYKNRENELKETIASNTYIAVGKEKVMPLYTSFGTIDGEAIDAAVNYLRETKYAHFGYIMTPSLLNSLIVEGIRRTQQTAFDKIQKDFPNVYKKFVDSARLYFAAQDIAALYHSNNADFFDALGIADSTDKDIPLIGRQVINDKAWAERQSKQDKNILAMQVRDLFGKGKPKYDMLRGPTLLKATISPKTGQVTGGVSLGSRIALVYNNNLREMTVLAHFVNLGNAYIEDGVVQSVDESIVAAYKDSQGKPVTVRLGMDDLAYMFDNDMPVFLGERLSDKETVNFVNWVKKNDAYANNIIMGTTLFGSLSFKAESVYDPFEGENTEEFDDIVDLSDLLKPAPGNPDFYTLSVDGAEASVPSSDAVNFMQEWGKAGIEDQKVAKDILYAMATTLKENPKFIKDTKGIPMFKVFLDSRIGTGHMTGRDFVEKGLAALEKTDNSKKKKWLNRATSFMTRSGGFGSQSRNLFGSEFSLMLGLDTMSNRVQQSTQELKRHVQENLVKKVFDNSLNKMVVWLNKTSADIPGVTVKLKDGQERAISKQEIMTLYLADILRAEYRKRQKDIDDQPYELDKNGNRIIDKKTGLPKMRKAVDLVNPRNGGIEAVYEKLVNVFGLPQIKNLIEKHLTEQDKKAVEAVLKSATQYASSNSEEGESYYYVPVTSLESLFGGSWANRKDNGYMVFGSNIYGDNAEIYPMGLYDGIMKMAAHTSLANNNFMAAIRTIKTLFDLGAKYKIYTEEASDAEKQNEAIRLSLEEDLKKQFKLVGISESEIGSFAENAKLLLDTVKKVNKMRILIEDIIGASNFDALMKGLEYEANIGDRRAIAMSAGAKVLDKMTHSVMSSLLFGKVKNMVFNFGGNYAIFAGLSDSSSIKYMTVDFANAVSNFSEAWKLAMDKGFILSRLRNAGISDQFERLSDMQRETLLTDITNWIDKHKHEKAADFMRNFEAWSKKLTKYGVGIASSLPDVAGIVLAYYSTRNSVLKLAEQTIAENGIEADVESMADEIFENYMLQHISNSSYMTRGVVQKKLAQMGLISMVAFTNDQLLKGNQLANAIKEYANTDDPAKKKRLLKEMSGIAWSSGIYVAVQAALFTTLARVVLGDGLDEEEEKQLYNNLIRETLGQLFGFVQYGNLFQDSVVDTFFGGQGDMSVIPLAQLSKAFSSGVRGKVFASSQEVASLIGLSWYKMITNWMSAIHQLAATDDITGDDLGVFGSRMVGFSENTSLKRRNLRKTDEGEYKKVKRKNKEDEEVEEDE